MKKSLLTLFLLTVILSWKICSAESGKVNLPITIDYPLLRGLLVSQAFPERGEQATLVNEGDGCISLSAARPQVFESNGLVRLELLITATGGTPLAGECYTPIGWQGYLVLYQRPVVEPASWKLSFVTESSEVLTEARQPAKVAAILWNMIEPQVTGYLAGITIDLLPPVNDIKKFLLPLFPDSRRMEAERMLQSMTPAGLQVGKGALEVSISALVDSTYSPDSQTIQSPLEREELEKTVSIWEQWDGLLIHLIAMVARQELNDQEKRSLVNLLLDTRHRFINELSDRTIQHDIIRQQFVSAWRVLSPIFRKHLLSGDQYSQALGYLAFVSSADALTVFDKLGPSFGLEISTAGLVRLMDMLNAAPSLLEYNHSENGVLQNLFDLNNDGPATEPPPPVEPRSRLWRWFNVPFYPAPAYADAKKPNFAEAVQWKVPKKDVAGYIARVEKVLHRSAVQVAKSKELNNKRQKLFRRLIPAMAWQESCFRQFVVKGDRLTYLLSYNNSSVGLMQVNERVWRGIYDINRLRWDIYYNAHAGSEIAAMYLEKYALRDDRKVSSMHDDILARLVYAMYNGGPSQYSKFFQRLEKKKFYQSDKLFWEKYKMVKAEEVEKVRICLVGG